MYCIIVYDVVVSRIDSVRITLKQYLNWIQNSVFEGEITPADLLELKSKITGLINLEEDSVLVFTVNNSKWIDKAVIGMEKNNIGNII